MTYEGNNTAAITSIKHQQLTKSIQTLIGICSGLTADNHLNDQEIHFLNIWLREYPETTKIWPGSIIAERVERILDDGVISTDERENLLETLKQLAGNYFDETGAAKNELVSIDYSIDTVICFNQMEFCFTGTFVFGTRSACKRITEKLGGITADNVSMKLDYLIIGTLVSSEWAYTSYGRKIEKAMQLRNKSFKPAVISEQQWINAIKSYIT